MEDFTDNLEDKETPVPAHVSQDSIFGTFYESGFKIKEAQHSIFPLPK